MTSEARCEMKRAKSQRNSEYREGKMNQVSLFDLLPEDDPMREAFAPKKSNDWKWSMKEDYPATKNGLKVFSCFACGGVAQWDINSLGARCLAAMR